MAVILSAYNYELIFKSGLQWWNRAVILFQLLERVTNELHDFHVIWSPFLDEMIATCVKQCKTCQVNQSMPASARIHYWERTTKPWVRIRIDFAGPYLGKIFLVLTDGYAKWMDIHSMSDIKTVTLIDALSTSLQLMDCCILLSVIMDHRLPAKNLKTLSINVE